MSKLNFSREDKRREASDIFHMIQACKNETELEEVSDYIDECIVIGSIFKKDHKYLSDELDDRLMVLVEEGLV